MIQQDKTTLNLQVSCANTLWGTLYWLSSSVPQLQELLNWSSTIEAKWYCIDLMRRLYRSNDLPLTWLVWCASSSSHHWHWSRNQVLPRDSEFCHWLGVASTVKTFLSPIDSFPWWFLFPLFAKTHVNLSSVHFMGKDDKELAYCIPMQVELCWLHCFRLHFAICALCYLCTFATCALLQFVHFATCALCNFLLHFATSFCTLQHPSLCLLLLPAANYRLFLAEL